MSASLTYHRLRKRFLGRRLWLSVAVISAAFFALFQFNGRVRHTETAQSNLVYAEKTHELMKDRYPASSLEHKHACPTRVFVLGIDGLSWCILYEMISQGELPTFEKLIAAGTSGAMLAPDALYSPVIWNTIATGFSAAEHGIVDFIDASHRLVTSQHRRRKAFWNILGEHGFSCGVFNWLTTFPAEKLRGVMVSGLGGGMPIDLELEKAKPGLQVQPPGTLVSTLGDLRYPPELEDAASQYNLNARVGKGFGNLLVLWNSLEFYRSILAYEEILYYEIYRKVADRQRFDVTALYFSSTDIASHFFFKGRRHEELKKNYRFFDSMLRDIVDQAIQDDTLLLVLSDHGFQSAHDLSPLNLLSKWSGEHEKHAVFISHGPGVERNNLILGATVYDICPTILSVCGLPPSSEMRGRPLLEVFEPTVRPRLTASRIETYEAERPAEPSPTVPEEYDRQSQKLLERLKAIGYIN